MGSHTATRCATDFRIAIPRRARTPASIARMATSVLVVDDDAGFRGLAVRLLAHMGFSVVGEAGTVAEATRAAAALRPDAVLVDVGLPDGDGIALAGELAALSWRPRVVLTSTDRDAATCESARAIGVAGFIAKDDLADGPLARLLGEPDQGDR
jgi:DNA-binding NarL/FixJ family response regulator